MHKNIAGYHTEPAAAEIASLELKLFLNVYWSTYEMATVWIDQCLLILLLG